jgi:murein tripeptide amidase MpaA
VPDVAFDRFYRFDELTAILRAWAEKHPSLFVLESIGRSYEGRDIWLATVTNLNTGPHDTKPGFWVEANIHASEHTGSAAALHLLHTLVSRYGSEPKVTRALDTRVFYVVPRLNPDGAELALADSPKIVRSSVRPYPREDEQDGLVREDVDGDGRILSMRIPDRNGAWKAYADDPRLLVRRDPDEDEPEATYYRVLPEGVIRNYDGVMIKMAPPLQGLDLNRNFPFDWGPENEQPGAGPFPTSEPEIRAEVEAIVARPNVCGYISYHTASGVHLRPYSGRPDDELPTDDLRTYRWIGQEATKITGYPAVSIFHDFKYHPKQVIKGGSDDWLYEHLGVYAWTTEFWSPMRAAGITDFKFIDWYMDHPVEDELKLLAWSDRDLAGNGYIDWYTFDHPQLGSVELGGWDRLYCWTNPPPHLLEAEIEKHSDFAVFHALISPKLELHSVVHEKVGDAKHFVRVVLVNTGWLPTNISQKALDRNAVRPVEVELTLPEGARLVGGETKVNAGQLQGRNMKRNTIGWRTDDATNDRTKLEWVIDAPDGGVLEIVARHQRAGVVRTEVQLG